MTRLHGTNHDSTGTLVFPAGLRVTLYSLSWDSPERRRATGLGTCCSFHISASPPLWFRRCLCRSSAYVRYSAVFPRTTLRLASSLSPTSEKNTIHTCSSTRVYCYSHIREKQKYPEWKMLLVCQFKQSNQNCASVGNDNNIYSIWSIIGWFFIIVGGDKSSD